MPNQGEEKKRIARRQIKRVVSISPADQEVKPLNVNDAMDTNTLPADEIAEPLEQRPEAVVEENASGESAETAQDTGISEQVTEDVSDTDVLPPEDEVDPAVEPSDVSSVNDIVPDGKKSSGNIGDIFRIGGVLLAVCAIVTLLLAVVNFLTVDRIADNKANDMNIAVKEIFPKSTASEEIEYIYAEPVTAVYKVMGDGGQLGYAVSAVSTGFGGNIEMLIGIAQNGSVAGVRIISHAETPNVGSKVTAAGYLSGYVGKSGSLVLKSDVDAISGATISSEAVLEGVNAALALGLKAGDADAADTGSTDITIDTNTPIPPDSSLETVPVTGEVHPLKYETLYRDETTAPESEKNETSIIEIYTDPVEETTVPAETTESAETTVPVTDDTTTSVE